MEPHASYYARRPGTRRREGDARDSNRALSQLNTERAVEMERMLVRTSLAGKSPASCLEEMTVCVRKMTPRDAASAITIGLGVLPLLPVVLHVVGFMDWCPFLSTSGVIHCLTATMNGCDPDASPVFVLGTADKGEQRLFRAVGIPLVPLTSALVDSTRYGFGIAGGRGSRLRRTNVECLESSARALRAVFRRCAIRDRKKESE